MTGTGNIADRDWASPFVEASFVTRHLAVTSETPHDTPDPERTAAMASQIVNQDPSATSRRHKHADLQDQERSTDVVLFPRICVRRNRHIGGQ